MHPAHRSCSSDGRDSAAQATLLRCCVAALLLANLDALIDDLDAGAVVVFDADRVRVRRLPIEPA